MSKSGVSDWADQCEISQSIQRRGSERDYDRVTLEISYHHDGKRATNRKLTLPRWVWETIIRSGLPTKSITGYLL